MKKSVLLLFTLLGLAQMLKAQTPTLAFSNKFIGPSYLTETHSVAIDGSGNSYIIGNYTGTVDFDPSVGVATLTSFSGAAPNLFVAKYNSTGAYQWAFDLGYAGNIGAGSTYAGGSITSDASGNIYITGGFSGTTDFDPSAGVANLTSTGTTNIFVAKYNSAGIYQWAFVLGSASMWDVGYNIAMDASGDIYVTGSFSLTIDFDPGVGTNNLSSSGASDYDVFVAKYSSLGSYINAFRVGGNGSDVGYGITTDATGNMYLCGRYQNTADFDPSGSLANLTAPTGYGGYVAKYNSSGVYQWAFNTAYNGSCLMLSLDASSNIYLVGSYSGTSDFDPSAGVANLVSASGEGFIAKYTSNGLYQWAFGFPNITPNYIKSDISGNIYTTGSFIGTADTDPSVGSNNHTSLGVSDLYFAKYNSSCAFQWSYSLGTTTYDNGYAITINPSTNDLFLAGGYDNSALLNKYCFLASTPGAISGTATICSGTTNTYSISAVSGATSYTWTLPGGWTGTSTTNSINATASATSGNVTVTANNACGNSSAATLAVTVNSPPSTPGTISGTATICSGTTNTYSITAVAGATSYTWTLPGGWTGTSTINSINATASATSGNITVTANNSCGSSSVQTKAITVNSTPATPGTISGTATICSGTTNTYSITAVAGATSYTWTLPSGWTGTSTTNSISTTASATSGNITVTANNSCGNSTASTLAITVNSIPATPGTISGTATICSGTTNSYSITAVAGATSYTWTLPGGWTGTSTTNSINATASATSGNVTVTANNSCGSSSVQTKAITVNSIPATPGVISGTATICSGTTNTYSITAVAGATSYTWTLPGGWTGTSTTNSINATASATSGNVTVTANNSCGNSSAATLAITVNSIPATPGTISGTATICSGTTNTYSITAVAGATSYTWTLPGGWTGTSTTNSISATASATSGNITVTANNACGSSATSTFAIIVNSAPSTPGTITGATNFCENITSQTYSVANDPSVSSYSWTLPPGWSGISTSNSIIASTAPSGGIISVIANNSCGTSGISNLTVTVNPLPSVTYSQNPDTVCIYNTPFALSGESPSGGTYSGAGVTGGIFDPNAAGNGTHTITYSYTDANSCSNTATQSIFVDICTSIENTATDQSILVYPNPAFNSITITGKEVNGASIAIVNVLGETVYVTNATSEKAEINITELQGGIYFIQLKAKNKTIVKKIIKE